MAKVETKQEQAPAAAEGEAGGTRAAVNSEQVTVNSTVKVRVLKTGTEIDGWRFASGALVPVTAKQAVALEADKAARRVY